MSLKDYIKVREYIVTVNSLEDLDDLYYELETDNVAPPNTELTRPVRLAEKRPVSRNTHYWLADWEADQLRFDPRVRVVELHPRYRGISAGTTTSTQTSNNWNKSNSTSSTMKNFALLRCTEGVQRADWGSNGSTQTQTGTITLNATGKNVDVVVVDDNGLVWNHPEYAVNADGSGGSRAIQYNWGQHDPVVKGTSASNYSYGVGSHSTHVAGTVAGNTQGWARDANIYNIYYLAGDLSNYNFPYVMDYVREFHRTKSVNVSTGRKNPTVTNNSWGMSIFPSEWSFSDITAVTYRGTRFTPETGGTTFAGISGVFTASTKLADLVGLANAGNRIVTAGSTVNPSTRLLSKPSSWTQDGGQTYLAYVNSSNPDPLYTVTVQGPCLVEVRNNIASGGFNGTTTLTVGVEILQGATSIANFSQGPTSGGDVELIIDEIVTLPNNAVYTINYTSTLNNATVENPITAVSMSTSITVIGGTASATVTPIANTFGSTAGLTFEQVPDFGGNDDGFWQLSLPFSITYCGAIYNEIYVGTNFYLTFGGGSNVYSGLGPGTPGYPKIMLTAADTSVQRIYYGTSGVSPDRTFRVRIEGTNRTSGILGSPNMLAEYTFYENAANRIDLQVGVNAQGSATGTFSGTQLNAWGFISGQRIPVRVSALDADIENAQEEGILYVGAAGNGRWKHDLPGGLDWDNTFEMNNRYPGQVYYYMRGTSPTANDSIAAGGTFNLNTICVGAVDVTAIETQSYYSDTGPGVDLHAPGTAIISSMPSGVTDPRSASYYLGKLNGTSMASPQVCGVLACALEIYPNMTPAQAKNYILGYAKKNQLTNNGGGPADTTDLQGSANLYLYYPQERPITGNVFPKKNYQFRPTRGNVYPRPKIRAKG